MRRDEMVGTRGALSKAMVMAPSALIINKKEKKEIEGGVGRNMAISRIAYTSIFFTMPAP